MLSDINYIAFRKKTLFLMQTFKCNIDFKCTVVHMFAFYFLICHFQIHLHCVPLPFAKTPFIIKVEPVHNEAGRQAGTRSLCLHCKCLEMSFPTLVSFVLSVFKCVALMMEEHIYNIHKKHFSCAQHCPAAGSSRDSQAPKFSHCPAAHFLN